MFAIRTESPRFRKVQNDEIIFAVSHIESNPQTGIQVEFIVLVIKITITVVFYGTFAGKFHLYGLAAGMGINPGGFPAGLFEIQAVNRVAGSIEQRSEEHTSELQSQR